jgi:hypothetical protein
MPYHFNPALDNGVKPSELLHDLSLRPALAPRDRSLVTISALIASGQTAQIPYHLKRALMYRYKLLIIKILIIIICFCCSSHSTKEARFSPTFSNYAQRLSQTGLAEFPVRRVSELTPAIGTAGIDWFWEAYWIENGRDVSRRFSEKRA